MKSVQRFTLIAVFMMMPLLSGCWLAAAAGAGAYGGYKMKEKGYTVQNPITKERGSSSGSTSNTESK